MTRETKVGLLIGLGVILLIGIIVSDHLSVASHQQGADLAEFGPQAQRSIDSAGSGSSASTGPTLQAGLPAPTPGPAQVRRPAPTIVTPQELDAFPPAPGPRAQPAPAQPTLQRALALDTTPRHTPSPSLEPSLSMPSGTPDPARPTAVEPSTTPTPQTRYHMVQPGQSLFEIAEQYYGHGEQWRLIAAHNPDRVRPNGQVNQHVRLVIPPATAAERLAVAPPGTDRPRTVQRSAIKVRSGDTLTGLAGRHLGQAHRWNELLDANRDQLDRPEDLRPGMTLKLPTGESFTVATADPAIDRPGTANRRAPAQRTYTVQAGDSLYRIAQQMLGDGGRWKEIRDANPRALANPDKLRAGQVLRIPRRD